MTIQLENTPLNAETFAQELGIDSTNYAQYGLVYAPTPGAELLQDSYIFPWNRNIQAADNELLLDLERRGELPDNVLLHVYDADWAVNSYMPSGRGVVCISAAVEDEYLWYFKKIRS